ncbi:MAG: glycine cleavage system protein GcvH [Deltaproteobacteria bacterium]|nr:glycine cleavage system protein GcvH [Deltaproteobacteria bacterium]MBW2070769.1 glycine cleavage system protein GcvH [Deltaproteobacteria bacterium]
MKITEDHVWVLLQTDFVVLGVTDFAAEALGTIIYVELPEVGETINKGESFATIESGKATIELISPVSGTVLQANEALEETPSLVNQDSLSSGWVARLKIGDASELDDLMSKPEYDLFVAADMEE